MCKLLDRRLLSGLLWERLVLWIPAQRKQAFLPVALELSVCFLLFALAMALRRIRKAIRKAGARTT